MFDLNNMYIKNNNDDKLYKLVFVEDDYELPETLNLFEMSFNTLKRENTKEQNEKEFREIVSSILKCSPLLTKLHDEEVRHKTQINEIMRNK